MTLLQNYSVVRILSATRYRLCDHKRMPAGERSFRGIGSHPKRCPDRCVCSMFGTVN